MNILEFAILKKMFAKGGGGSNGLVDVDSLESIENIDENAIYRLQAGLYEDKFKIGTTYFVDELPEVGECFSMVDDNQRAIYYNKTDGKIYIYLVLNEAADEFEWMDEETLVSTTGISPIVRVENLESMTEKGTFYFLLTPLYYVYKNGEWAQLSVGGGGGETFENVNLTVYNSTDGHCDITYTNSEGEEVTDICGANEESYFYDVKAGTDVSISGNYSSVDLVLNGGETLIGSYPYNEKIPLPNNVSDTLFLMILG